MIKILRYRKPLLTAFLLTLCVLIALPAPVLAIDNPDSPPRADEVTVYEDLLEDGDVGVLIDYYLDYAVNPTETANEAYMAVFVDTDGSTQIRSVAPYVYQDSGYGRGSIWIYFTAAEATAYGLDSTLEDDYEIWMTGNPTLGWVGDPPKTIVGIDEWWTTGDPAVLLARQVLRYADILELAWSLDLIETTSIGSRLTTLGESYFGSVITNLRDMAPAAFSSGILDPTIEDIDYTTSFGATMTDGTGTVTGSPITLTEGDNTVTTTVVGTFTLELEQGTVGTFTDDTGTATDSPLDLVAGTNTVTVTANGDFTVNVVLEDTQTVIVDTITGTGLDLTEAAALVGMSRMMFSGLVWLILSIVICAGTYRLHGERFGAGTGKVVLLVFDVCIIGGAVLGLMSLLFAVLMFIGFGILTGYVLFFRGANI